MRKDIVIPEVKDVYVAAVYEFNEDFNTHDWNAYIINDGMDALETVLIVSQGYDDKDLTAPMRHSLQLLPAKGYAKIEFLDVSVLRLDNFFTITYFIGDKLYDKRFELPANSVIEDNRVPLPVMDQKGVLAR
ncbi:MAG: hypothetical protein KJO05_07330 [Bacteroidia bacterium]|nr:hypothetical protein [Bacteroidia bacterium]NNF31038.1 hypothetical protein [Flavobacteriaceae bacterium]MBT8274578.1 hypothetical protein [Bacteroidia bacterium]NNJ81572.1 hypothetical protein [Flavobacteriaceae bacterium]NNK53959.1 hypothetical protein [Flavobacteriaceae bacterium]